MKNEKKIAVRTKRLATSVQIEIGMKSVTMSVLGWDKPFSELDDFALWAGMPFAMRSGLDLHIEGPVSRSALEGAATLVEYWSCWTPQQFHPIDVTADTVVENSNSGGSGKLFCYSGGVDSTYALAKHCLENDEKIWLLTVHGGFGYSKDNADAFRKLLDKTEPTRERFGLGNIIVRSNLQREYRNSGINTLHAIGFLLSSPLFLFDHEFSSGVIASDNPKHLEVVRMPYGSNTISNPLHRNDRFEVETWGLEAARSQKLAYLIRHKSVLSTLSFCNDHGLRPKNCGLCAECLRAKGIFLAETGTIPDIFIVKNFEVDDLIALSFKDNFQLAAMDIIWSARRNGRTAMFSSLEELVSKNNRPGGIKRRWHSLSSKLRARAALRGSVD